jgi:AbrB family looped-hinge helix DNA binding protein
MHITQKGQVTIPLALRETMGFLPNTEVEYYVDENNRLYLEKKSDGRGKKGASLICRMKGKATTSLSTDQILALTRGEK